MNKVKWQNALESAYAKPSQLSTDRTKCESKWMKWHDSSGGARFFSCADSVAFDGKHDELITHPVLHAVCHWFYCAPYAIDLRVNKCIYACGSAAKWNCIWQNKAPSAQKYVLPFEKWTVQPVVDRSERDFQWKISAAFRFCQQCIWID